MATAAVKRMFREYVLDDAQTEKRAIRRVQEVASRAMQAGAPPFQDRLGEVAAIVLDAMKADSITILLYERSQELVACASSGVAEESLGHCVADLQEHTLAGYLARSQRQPFSLLDVETTHFAISDVLRNSGMHSLLGASLPLCRDFIGVMYISVREIRPFDAREKRRLEALAERLALHLDAATLQESLVARNLELTREKAVRERFVAVLAHDLRGPLTAARLTAEQLVRHPERLDTRRELVGRILHNIDRTDQMVRDLLDANRIQAGQRLPLQIDVCDLNVIAADVIKELEQGHGKRFVLDSEPEVTGLWSAENLRRAIWNLAMNAAKYGAPAEPITIRIGQTALHVKVSVHNLGPVLSETQQQDLLTPYYRTAEAESSNATGWGLGLTLVQGCAEAHGGKLDITSDTTGTTFTLTLPLDATSYQPLLPDLPLELLPLH